MQYKRYSNRYTYSRPIRRQPLMIAPPKYVSYRRSKPTRRGGDHRAIIFLIGLAILGILAWKSVPHPVVAAPKSITQVSVNVIAGQHDVREAPTISVSTINTILCNAGSPACGDGQDLYNLGAKYSINPAYALAFFHHESSYGTAGEAVATLALGNERCISDRPCIDQDRGGYAQFYSWQDGFEHWYMLIRNLYINTWGCATIETIIPHYAPTADNNDEYAYESAVISDVQSWK